MTFWTNAIVSVIVEYFFSCNNNYAECNTDALQQFYLCVCFCVSVHLSVCLSKDLDVIPENPLPTEVSNTGVVRKISDF